jgi:DNA-binding beta-propeller fold protein YncE
MPTLRPAVLMLCATLFATVVAADPSVAAASTSSASERAYPLTVRLGVTQQARMVYAHGELFVSDGHGGSGVKVYTTSGKLVHNIADEPGADGMVVSADGNTVYVAQSATNKISAINTATFAHTEFTVDSCPTNLALAAGRLFYSFGCDSDPWASGVSSIDPSSGGTPVAALTNQYEPPLLAAAGATLAVAVAGLSPAPLATYTSDGAGVVTPLGSIQDNDGINDLAISSDGDNLYTAAPAGAQFKKYDSATLSQVGEFAGSAYPSAVAVSPNGEDLAGGMHSYEGLVNLYNAASITPIWKRYGASTAPSTWRTGEEMDATLPGSLTFASNGSHVYGLVAPENSNGVDLFSSTLAPTATHIHVDISHASAHRLTATAHVPAHGKVVFTGIAAGTPTTIATVTSNGKGVARLRFRFPYSASIQAAFVGTDSRFPATAKKSFTMPSSSALKLSRSYATKHGTKLYRNRKAVLALATVTPAVSGREIAGWLEARINGKWQVTSRVNAPLSSAGTVTFFLRKHASRHLELRFKFAFKGDSFNTGSRATSKPFEIT